MHAKPDLRVVLKWMINRSGSVITDVMLLINDWRHSRDLDTTALNADSKMGYEIHIENQSGEPLDLEDWKSVVDKTDGLKLDDDGQSVTNPATGEVITMGGSDGDAEMLLGDKWLPVFRWTDSRISFSAQASFEDRNDPVRKMATHVANELNAQVVGDEGETYD